MRSGYGSTACRLEATSKGPKGVAGSGAQALQRIEAPTSQK